MEDDPTEMREMDFLMSGETDVFDSFSEDVVSLVLKMLGREDDGDNDGKNVVRQEIIRIMGIRRTNANAMGSCLETKQGNLLFPVYSLMNAECYCNTYYVLEDDGDGGYAIKVRAQRDITAGEVRSAYAKKC